MLQVHRKLSFFIFLSIIFRKKQKSSGISPKDEKPCYHLDSPHSHEIGLIGIKICLFYNGNSVTAYTHKGRILCFGVKLGNVFRRIRTPLSSKRLLSVCVYSRLLLSVKVFIFLNYIITVENCQYPFASTPKTTSFVKYENMHKILLTTAMPLCYNITENMGECGK